ncbi:MAG: threonylcarbamoyl-AMP synthase [Hyphomicrobiales bacterium]|nr:threonylcarbamoyl-AMP synthase [Hyphomicrobiales bacterium]
MSVLPANEESIADAAERLRRGGLVAFPTETVYGLGADAGNGRAVAALYAAKGRPRFNPLIVHVADAAAAARYAAFTETANRLAEAFWPGGLTLVLPKAAAGGIAELTTAGLDTVALRAPDHPVARALLAAADVPVAAPSANRSGHVSPTTAAHVAEDLGDRVDVILDGGPTAIGIESTVVDASGVVPTLLRPGAVPRAEIEAVLGCALAERTTAATPTSPGQLASHYAPRAALRLNALSVEPGEALLAFGPDVPTGACRTINLSAKRDLGEAAANLFGALRALDATGVPAIAVMPIPDRGLGEAINDRLRRGAAPR